MARPRIRTLALVGSPLSPDVDRALAQATGATLARHRQLTDANTDAAVLVDPGDGECWLHLDRARVDGLRAPVVVVAESGPPAGHRAVLEPVVHLRPPPTAQAIATALDGLGRRTPPTRVRLPAGILRYDQARFERTDGTIVKLTPRELDLLAWFLARPFTDTTRDTLQVQVWGHVKPSPGRAVDMAISRLRKKIEADPSQPTVLVSARGDGYRLVLPAPPRPAAAPGAFVGRTEALATLGRAHAASRWVQVTGPPGVGKSRLVRESLVDSPTPVAWVAATRCATEADLLEALAGRLGFDLGTATDGLRARELVRRQLGLRDALHLVLDGVDRLVEPLAGLLPEWLAASPGLRISCTARRRVSGATVVDLAPLDPEAAAALFTDRARAAGWTDTPDPSALSPVLAPLDGLPLAVELAAARMRSRTLPELERGLADRFALLRQRGGTSLDASLALSWELLDPSERSALATLAHLPGALPRDLAAAVVPSDWLLDDLVDASLLQTRPEGPTTWVVLLDSVRAWALARAPDPAAPVDALDPAAAWARRVTRQLDGVQGRDAASTLARTAGTLRALWRLAAAADHPSQPALLEAIDAHHVRHTSLDERRRFLDQAFHLARPSARPTVALLRATAALAADRSADIDDDLALASTDPALEARTLLLTAQRHVRLGRLDLVRQTVAPHTDRIHLPLHQRAAFLRLHLLTVHMAHGAVDPAQLDRLADLAEALQAADHLSEAVRCLNLLALVKANHGELSAARDLADRVHTLAAPLSRLQERYRAAELQVWLAIRAGDHRGALDHAARIIQRFHAAGYDTRARYLRQSAAESALHTGDHDRALAELAHALQEAAGRDRAHALELTALVHLDRSEPAQARQVLEEALDLARDGGDAILLADLWMHLGTVRLLQGDPDGAHRTLAEVDATVLPALHAVDLTVRRWHAARAAGHHAVAHDLREALERQAADPHLAGRHELQDWLAGRPTDNPTVSRRLWDRLGPTG